MKKITIIIAILAIGFNILGTERPEKGHFRCSSCQFIPNETEYGAPPPERGIEIQTEISTRQKCNPRLDPFCE